MTGGVPFVATDYSTGAFEEADVARPLTHGTDRSRLGIVLPFDTTQITSKTNRSHPKPGDPCHPLAKGAHAPAVAPTLGVAQYSPTRSPSGQQADWIVRDTTPRRLTPVEAERLQGLPDGWTAWGVDEDGERVEMADTPRYRMLGNAVTMPVAAWIGRRILELS